eukprot:1160262-Pelagomonas_calceolata.AAC.6
MQTWRRADKGNSISEQEFHLLQHCYLHKQQHPHTPQLLQPISTQNTSRCPSHGCMPRAKVA